MAAAAHATDHRRYGRDPHPSTRRAALRPLDHHPRLDRGDPSPARAPARHAYFTWFVTGLATGLGLAITLLGIPLLTLVLASVRPLLAAERSLANSLLGTDIPPAGSRPGATAGSAA